MAIHTIVYVDLDTKRILGFSPEGMLPLFPQGVRYATKTVSGALELEKQVDQYRREQAEDLEQKTYRQLCREAPIRKGIADAIRARSQSCNSYNRDLNTALLGLMDSRYEQTMKAKSRAETFLMAEAYDESKCGEDLALENPVFKAN